jgi:carbon monoxide dehydrogenase subunit G
MFIFILVVIAVAIIVLLFNASRRPDTFRLERSISIQAPAEKVFQLINNFHQWVLWSPWEHIDPAMKKSYSGPADGKGTIYAWEGNSKIGSGRMEILQSTPLSKILIKLDFFKPFKAHNTAEFTLVEKGESTVVTWAMYGDCNLMSKVMQQFCSMEKMVGPSFEKGLDTMKGIAEHSQ